MAKNKTVLLGKSEGAIDISKLKSLKVISLPVWAGKMNKKRFMRIETEMKPDESTITEERPEPAYFVEVTNLENGIRCKVMLGKSLRSDLETNYPNQGYIGKMFSVLAIKNPGQNSNSYHVEELIV